MPTYYHLDELALMPKIRQSDYLRVATDTRVHSLAISHAGEIFLLEGGDYN